MSGRACGGDRVSPAVTDRRTVVLATIAASIDVNGYPPTIRELAAMTGRNKDTIRVHLQWLVDAGYLERTPGIPRGMRLLPRGRAVLPVANATDRTAPRRAAS